MSDTKQKSSLIKLYYLYRPVLLVLPAFIIFLIFFIIPVSSLFVIAFDKPVTGVLALQGEWTLKSFIEYIIGLYILMLLLILSL